MAFYDKQTQAAPVGGRMSQEEANRRKLDLLAQDK